MFKKFIAGLALITIAALGVTGCGNTAQGKASDDKNITYGKAAGPYTVLFEDAIIPILEKEGYTFTCVEFSDLLQNDTALNEGDIDVNVEQHTAYLKNFNETQDGDLVALSPIPTVPAGIFSANHTSIDEITQGASVAVPNDASNTARAYRLLEKAGWITLDANADISKISQDDIIDNPYEIVFTELDSTIIPRSLDEFDFAVITGSIVYSAGIDASTALLQEDIADHLLLQVVVKEENKDSQWAKAIVDAYHSQEFKDYIAENNDGLWYIPEELQ